MKFVFILIIRLGHFSFLDHFSLQELHPLPSLFRIWPKTFKKGQICTQGENLALLLDCFHLVLGIQESPGIRGQKAWPPPLACTTRSSTMSLQVSEILSWTNPSTKTS